MAYFDIHITHKEYAVVTVHCDTIEQAKQMADGLEDELNMGRGNPDMWEHDKMNLVVHQWDGRHDRYRLMPA